MCTCSTCRGMIFSLLFTGSWKVCSVSIPLTHHFYALGSEFQWTAISSTHHSYLWFTFHSFSFLFVWGPQCQALQPPVHSYCSDVHRGAQHQDMREKVSSECMITVQLGFSHKIPAQDLCVQLGKNSAVGAEEMGREAQRNQPLLRTVPIEVSAVSDSGRTRRLGNLDRKHQIIKQHLGPCLEF